MCGIAGFIENRRTDSVLRSRVSDRLSVMLRAIKHRGPDDWGMTFFGFQPDALDDDERHVEWTESPDTYLALGHQRLSILDLSPNGRQPMFSADGAYCITFNGEIYNYIELREELSRTVEFRTRTDTEVLLEAYRQWGIDMLQRLDGMFAFALWDGRAKKLVCARDPLGIKPFYFAKQNATFFFASEPRAILAGLGVRGTVDRTRIAEFLIFGVSDYDEGTSYQEVRQLQGGHFFEIDSAGFASAPRRFWKPPQEIVRDNLDVPSRVRLQIKTAVRRQLRSDVPVGSCLSGGLDSGSVVASIGKILGSNASAFKALTLTDENFEGDESDLARATAQRANVRWEKVESNEEDTAGEIWRMIQGMDEPFPSLSMLGQRKVMQHARELGLKVMLDGQGGDEVFLGYPRVAMRVVGEHLCKGRISAGFHELGGLRHNASQSISNILLSNVFFASPSLVHWRNKRRIAGIVEKEFLEQARLEVADKMYNHHQTVYDLQVGELTQFCLPQLLRFEDRNSMAFGVEARVPLLSVDLVEMALGLPLKWKVRRGWTKYALRTAMKDLLPAKVAWCHRKRGFEVPQGRWVEAARPEISEWLDNLPHNSPLKRQQIISNIDAGRGGEHWFWRCLSVALWMCCSGVQS
jgi:asparagine synthase (glutamine-hydrolysing)